MQPDPQQTLENRSFRGGQKPPRPRKRGGPFRLHVNQGPQGGAFSRDGSRGLHSLKIRPATPAGLRVLGAGEVEKRTR